MARLSPVDLDFVRTAPKRYVFEATVPADRARVFAAVSGDPGRWKDWFPGMSGGAYEGEPGVGAFRVVTYRGTTFFETILAWDEPSRWTFRVDRSTVPIARALVEDWTFEERDDGTLARWTFAIEPTVLFRLITPVMVRVMARLFRRAMRNLGDVLARSPVQSRHDRGSWADDTRERILDTAERLFAASGIEGASLREITREAEVNIAAIHYHYGSRDGLVRAVLDRVVVPLNRTRVEMLDRALGASNGQPLAVDVVLEAFIRPDLEAVEDLRDGRGVIVARFLGRTYGQPTPLVQQIMAEQFAVVGTRFIGELVRSLPHVPPEEIQWRMWRVVGVLVSLFAQATPRSVPGPFDTGDVDATLARILAFVEPGFRAPAPKTKRTKTRSR